MTEIIQVAVPGKAYEVRVGPALISDAGTLLAGLGLRGRVLVVTNPTVARWYLEPLSASLARSGFQTHAALVPDGEEYKSLIWAGELYERAAASGLDRTDTVAALGGGVIGDLAGFVAATYLRGVPFVQVPTTLLAQIDSGIGGKVAVNLPAGKNLAGAFHQPRLVLADIDTLSTLPERELRAGLIEMLKHGLLEAEYFSWYEKNLSRLLASDREALTEGIAWSGRIKAAVVAADEREESGRAFLNLGHTVGHALETAAGYGTWRHGEAVALGLIVAGRLSRRLGFLDTDGCSRLERVVLSTIGGFLPVLAETQIGPALEAMQHDKKIHAGRLRFVLLAGIGRPIIAETVTPELIRGELQALMGKEPPNA